MPDGGIRVELPDQRRSLSVCDSQPLVQRCRPSTRVGDAPGADAQLIDPDDERSTRARPAHGDGPDQRMACVELAVARLETISGPGPVVRRPDPQPASGVENEIESPGSIVSTGSRSREKWPCSVRRSSGISCRATYVASRRRTASTTRSTDGMYASSICQYGYGTS